MSDRPSWPRQAFVAGEWRSAARTFPVRNPATGETLAEIADCGADEGRRALESAVEAFPAWKATPGAERSRILRRWCDLMTAQAEDIARSMTLEMGKPIVESRYEAKYAASFVDYYAEAARRIGGELLPAPFPHKRFLVRHEPVGPAYGITPWNFPAAMVTRKAAPALAAGCPFILKPAEQSPLTALLLAQLWEQAGGPKGVFQVLPALDPVPMSQVLISDPRIRKLTFTGSTDVGRLLYAQAAQTLKRVSLELGGNAPFLVFEDADMEKAAKEVAASKFRNAGQTCICTNRVLVQESIQPRFTEAFSDLTASLKVGDPMLEDTQIGPLVDQQGFAKVRAAVADAVAKGARVAVGGEPRGGLFFAPTVLTGVRRGMKVLDEETFGPVAPVAPFRDEAEAVAMANATGYGLAGYLWTRDLGRAFRVAEALEYGLVGVNDGVPSAMAPHAPFGGMKDSGVGREGGPWGLDEYLEVKLISMAIV
ncbi:MAG TPA: NAD-dependent succinate-semialdehyde dehydrogenase [Vicinamibacteria bacterium]|nr:NAD-dependent succinate-semialdehyde dehydrogenase [Vicinamibacteria bacterium]